MGIFTGSKDDVLNETLTIREGSSATIGIFLELPEYTTTVRDTLTNMTSKSVIMNSTTSKINFYNGNAWEAVTSA